MKRQPVKPSPLQVWFTAAEATEYLRFSTVDAFHAWRRRHGVHSAHRGRVLLFMRRDLDAAIGAQRTA